MSLSGQFGTTLSNTVNFTFDCANPSVHIFTIPSSDNIPSDTTKIFMHQSVLHNCPNSFTLPTPDITSGTGKPFGMIYGIKLDINIVFKVFDIPASVIVVVYKYCCSY